MLPFSVARNITFTVVDINSNPVTGLGLGNFQVTFFRNNVACVDPLHLTELGSGRYSVTYQPSGPGHDYLELYSLANDIRIVDEEDLVSQADIVGAGNVTSVDQNYPSAGYLQVLAANPETWTLLVFTSQDWDLQNRADANALGITSVATNGNWINPINVPTGRYHIVIRRGNVLNVMKAYMEIPTS